MISAAELRKTAERKLGAATRLIDSHPDEAVELAAMAVEIRLKAKAVDHLHCPGLPSNAEEFKQHNLEKLKTHNLNDLLVLSGQEDYIKKNCLVWWSTCQVWNPNSRYGPAGAVAPAAARDVVDAASALLRRL